MGISIYDLHKLSLEEDEPYINLICEDLSELIQEKFLAKETIFYYDTAMVTENLEPVQSNRIMDEVIKYFRKRGIRINIAPQEVYDDVEAAVASGVDIQFNNYYFYLNDSYAPYYISFRQFNYLIDKNYILEIRLNIRLEQEYMKSYM